MSNRISDFVGVQAKLREASHLTPFDGWVLKIEKNQMWIRSESGPQIIPGTVLQVELNGRESIAKFEAAFVRSYSSNFASQIERVRIGNADGQVPEIDQVEYLFYMISGVQFFCPTGSYRVDAEGLFAIACIKGKRVEFELRDLGTSSFSAHCDQPLSPGVDFEVTIRGPQTCVVGAAQIKNCVQLIEGQHYQIEAEFDPAGRIDAGRWRSLLKSNVAA